MTSSRRRDVATPRPSSGTARADRLLPPAPTGTGLDPVRALLHDLRQPLAAIRVLSDPGPAGPGGGNDDPVHEGADPRLLAIHRQALWLSELVEQVLGAGRSDPVLSDLRPIVAECLSGAAVTSPCELRLEPGGAAPVLADPRALWRALGCVVDNAARAAGPGGNVVVRVRTTADEVTVAVADDGPGPGGLAPQTSMGLTIARALLAGYGGTVGLHAGSSGGAVAVITLPSAPARRGEAVAS
ncbi:MAG TPA: HAMP domain-containing sensor histidine kinase [Dermatophilaceae bacterium]|nr:HAMP domain-containing sensor histidine kinase [Dermatophilaceae bacterium]